MNICRMVFLVALGMGAAATLEAQEIPGVLLASEAPLVSLFPELSTPAHASLLETLRPAGSAGAVSPAPAEPASTPNQPLTRGQRLILFWNDTYASPGAFAGVGLGAMMDQIRHTPAKWDGDGSGYTRRFASEYGQLATRNVIHEGLAGLTGLDPRYSACTCKGTLKRSAHALEMTLTTHRQDGRLTLDVPQLAGAYGSGIVSTFWYPHNRYSPLVQGVQFGHEQVGEIAINNLVQEFAPDIKRMLHVSSWTARRVSRPDDDD